MIPAGKLRHRVTLQSKGTPTRDAMGGEVITWTDVATVWADVSALSGRALIAAQQAQSEVTARIIVRKAAAGSIADDWRIKHGSDIYTLHAIIPSDDGVDYNLQCSKGLKNG